MHVRADSGEWGEGKYVYSCGMRQRGGCEGGNFSIRAHLLDPFAYEAMTAWMAAYRHGALRQKMIEQLGLDKVAALVSMAEGYEAQLAEKRTELETTRRRARQTSDDTLAAQFIRDAEELNASITALEAEHKEAHEALDSFHAGNAWVDSTLERIKAGMHDIESPTEADIRALPYEERRLLLASLGLYLKVYPTGWRDDGRRVLVDYHFLLDPITNEPMKLGERRCPPSPSHATMSHSLPHASMPSCAPVRPETSRPTAGSPPRLATHAERAWSAGS